MPTGMFALNLGVLALLDGDKTTVVVRFQSPEPIHIEEGKTTTLVLDKPELDITVREQGGQLKVRNRLQSKAGLTFANIQAVGEDGSRSAAPREVKVLAANSDEVLGEGKIEDG